MPGEAPGRQHGIGDHADRRFVLRSGALVAAALAVGAGAWAKAGGVETAQMSDSDQNKRVVRALIDNVWIKGRLDDLPLYWSGDCVNHADPGPEKTGLSALRRYHDSFGPFFASFSDVDIQLLQQIAEGDRVVTQIMTSMRHSGSFMGAKATGRTVQLATIRIDRIAQGKIAEHWSVADMAGLIHQVQA